LIEVAKTSDIPEGEARRFVVERIEIAVANLGSGRFFAVDDICSHAESHLSEGEVDMDDETIESRGTGRCSTSPLAGRSRCRPRSRFRPSG